MITACHFSLWSKMLCDLNDDKSLALASNAHVYLLTHLLQVPPRQPCLLAEPATVAANIPVLGIVFGALQIFIKLEDAPAPQGVPLSSWGQFTPKVPL